MTKVALKTKGMMCGACEMLIETTLSAIEGVSDVDADYAKEMTTVTFDEKRTDLNRIISAIKGAGYDAEVLTVS